MFFNEVLIQMVCSYFKVGLFIFFIIGAVKVSAFKNLDICPLRVICFRNAFSRSDSSFIFLLLSLFEGVSSKWICMYVFVGVFVCLCEVWCFSFLIFYYWSIIDLETVVAPVVRYFYTTKWSRLIDFFSLIVFWKQTFKIFMKSNLPVYSFISFFLLYIAF